MDYRIITAPMPPSNFIVRQINATNPLELQATWGLGVPVGESYALRFYIFPKRNDVIVGPTIETAINTFSADFSIEGVNTGVKYEIYARNSQTEPKTGNFVFSNPAAQIVAIPSPPRIDSVSFSTSQVILTLTADTPLQTLFEVCIIGASCTTSGFSRVAIDWSPNLRQTIRVRNVFATTFYSSAVFRIATSPPVAATQGSFSVVGNTATLQWVQPVSGTIPIRWYISIMYSSNRQVLISNSLVNTTPFSFVIQQGSSYIAEVVAFNGWERAQSVLVIPFGTIPHPVSITTFQLAPRQSQVSISHIRESNQNIVYRYSWIATATQRVLYSVNSTNTTVVWNHQGIGFTNATMSVLVSAGNTYGLSVVSQQALITQPSVVNSISEPSGVHSFTISTNTISTMIVRYHLMIRDVVNGDTIVYQSSSLNNTFVVSTLQPVTLYSILTSLDLLVINNQTVSSIPSMNASFITPPLAMQRLQVSFRNETSVGFVYQDHPRNPTMVQSILIQLFDTPLSPTPQWSSNTLFVHQIPSSSIYFASIAVTYGYGIVNRLAVPINVTTPPFAPQLDMVEFESNSQFAVYWKPPMQQGQYAITLYHVTVSVQNSSQPASVVFEQVMSDTNLTNSQWSDSLLNANAKYSISIASVNSESISSIQYLHYAFFSYPENPVNFIEPQADYMIVFWKLPATAHPSLAYLAYEIVYYLKDSIDQNTTIQMNITYVPHFEVRRIILGLEPDREYYVQIRTIALYRNGVTMATEFSNIISTETISAYAPQAPTLLNIDSNFLTTTSFLVEWNALTVLQSGNAKLSHYMIYLNYTQNGVAQYREFLVEVSTDDTVLQYSVTDVPSGTTFAITMAAENRVGPSPLSNVTYVTTLPDIDLNSIASIVSMAILIPLFAVGILLCIFIVVFIAVIAVILHLKKKNPNRYLSYQVQKSRLPTEVGSHYIIQSNDLLFTDSVVLGAGAQGSVCTAQYKGIPVAVKIYPRVVFGVETDLSDFRTESIAMAQYSNHINIVRFIGISEDSERDQVMLVT